MDTKNPRRVAAGAQGVAGYNTEPSSTAKPKRPTLSVFGSDTHTVHISRDKGVFMVAVVPPVSEYPAQLFATHKAARGFAGGIRICRRWPIHDETMEADNG